MFRGAALNGVWRDYYSLNDTMNNVLVCAKCDSRQKKCSGPCACLIDGRDIRDHAESGYCPKGYFADVCQRCGGQHNVAVCQIPPDTDTETERRRAKQGGCCGAPTA
jgi:hypothetical protein